MGEITPKKQMRTEKDTSKENRCCWGSTWGMYNLSLPNKLAM